MSWEEAGATMEYEGKVDEVEEDVVASAEEVGRGQEVEAEAEGYYHYWQQEE